MESLKNEKKTFTIPFLDISTVNVFRFSSNPFSMTAFIFNKIRVPLSILLYNLPLHLLEHQDKFLTTLNISGGG